MDIERYFNALSRVLNDEHKRAGIGTYGEKTIHSVLKCYFEPFEDNHEQKIGGFVADIVGESGIIEIQTAGFDRLRKKLAAFLEVSEVTVVYPIPLNKWLIPIEPESGIVGKRRKSPKKGSPYDIFPELYKIKPFIKSERLKFSIVMLDVEEYRQPPEKTGLKRGRKKGFTRYDRIPVALCEEIHLDTLDDWLYFIPDSLPDSYTSGNFAEKSGITKKDASLVLNILTEKGICERIGKSGNSYLYRTVIPK